MRLSAAQEERYSRHLLLDGVGGDGQERLLAATVRVRGPAEAGRWAVRYLAASGVGALVLEEEWAEDVAAECRDLAPDVRILGSADGVAELHDVEVAPVERPAAAALEGARAALAMVRRIAQGTT